MVNLTIRLGKAGGGSGKHEQSGGGINSVTTTTTKEPSRPPHLVDTDLPLLRGVGTVFSEPCAVNFVGVKARRRPGDKVHICVRCNFPIAVYGRLIPCEHVFCLTCAKLDPACFLCEERVTRIQKMDVLEGIFICGAPGCLCSFLARSDFDLHITEAHPQLLQMEQGRLSPERNAAAGNSVPEAQIYRDLSKELKKKTAEAGTAILVQSHQTGQQHTDIAPPARQSSGTLQVILPKKEEPQRRPPKGVRQDPQGLLARPVPELRLPDQFPHHRSGDQHNTNQSNRGGGDQHTNRERENDVGPQGRDQKPRRRSEWDKIPQGQVENEREHRHEGEPQRERWEEGGSKYAAGQKKDGEKDRGPQPPSLSTPKADQQQKQPVSSLPPPPYPPSNFSPAYLPQPDCNSFSSRFDAPRGFHPGYHEGFNQNGPPLRPILDGYGQNGPPRPMNGSRPHFYPEYGPPMGMLPLGGPRYHEGHLPPPPGPPPKRAKFSEDPVMDYNNWGPGNPGNFGGHPGYPNWMPPANS